MKHILTASALICTLIITPFAYSEPSGETLSIVAAMGNVDHDIGEVGYLHLAHHVAGLQATLVSIESAPLSPQVVRLEAQTDGSLDAAHSYTTLSQIVDHYWYALTDLGFAGVITSMTPNTSIYTFTIRTDQLVAVFTDQGKEVTVNLAWVQRKLEPVLSSKR